MNLGEDLSPPGLGWAGLGSVGLTLGGGSGAEVTVTADGHGVGVEGVHTWGTPGQLHRHHPGLVVGADPVVGLDVRRLQDRLLREEFKVQDKRLQPQIPQGGFCVNRGATGSGGRENGN